MHRFLIAIVSNRSFRVLVNTSLSKIFHLSRGVPQGSCLGPLLFIIYINDLPSVIPNGVTCTIFADDVKLTTTNDCHLLQRALDAVAAWASFNSLSLSSTKSVVLPMGKHHPDFTFYINNVALPNVTQVRDLGIVYDSALSFDSHIHTIISRARATSNFILRSFRSRNPKLLFQLFRAYVVPILEYGSSLWNPYLLHHIKSIEDIQRSFTRRAFFRSNIVPPYEERLHLLCAQPLKDRRLLADLCQAFSIIRGFSSLHAEKLFIFSRRNYVSRSHSYKIVPPKYSSAIHANSFNSRIANSWNSLPAYLIILPSTEAFRIACSEYLSSLPH